MTPTRTPTLGFVVDHYKCYDVKEADGEPKFPGLPATIMDQFDSKGSQVKRPKMLCNAAMVDTGGQPMPIKNPEDHLVCYQIKDDRPRAQRRDLFARNQLGESQKLNVRNPRLVCVPSNTMP